MAMAVLAIQQKMAAIKIQRAYRSMVSRRERIKKRKEQIEQLRPKELQISKPPTQPQNEIIKSITEAKTPQKRKSVEKLFEFKTKNGHAVHANIMDFENGDHKLCLVSAVKPKNRQVVGLKQTIENP
jgi:reverse gyrase